MLMPSNGSTFLGPLCLAGYSKNKKKTNDHLVSKYLKQPLIEMLSRTSHVTAVY